MSTSGAMWGDWEKHPSPEGEKEFVVLKGKVWVAWGSGDPAGGAKRVRRAIDLRGATSVNPIEEVGAFIRPGFGV